MKNEEDDDGQQLLEMALLVIKDYVKGSTGHMSPAYVKSQLTSAIEDAGAVKQFVWLAKFILETWE